MLYSHSLIDLFGFGVVFMLTAWMIFGGSK